MLLCGCCSFFIALSEIIGSIILTILTPTHEGTSVSINSKKGLEKGEKIDISIMLVIFGILSYVPFCLIVCCLFLFINNDFITISISILTILISFSGIFVFSLLLASFIGISSYFKSGFLLKMCLFPFFQNYFKKSKFLNL